MMLPGKSPFKKATDSGSDSVQPIRTVAAIPTLLLEARRSNKVHQDFIPENPSVGVVICAYNEERNIGSLLANLVREHIQEIIVVASGCTDKTVEIARRFQLAHPQIRVLIENTRTGKTSAINLALKNATTEYLVFVPADVRPAAASIAKLIEGFKPSTGIRVGRPVPVDEESTLLGRLSHLIWTLHNRTLLELSREGILGHASGEFFAIRQGIISELPTGVVNDDAYMAVAVRKAGFRIDYENDAVAFMKGPRTVSDYVSQRRRVHFGHVQVLKSTGQYPTVFETQVVARPTLFLKLLRDELKHLKGGMRALTMGITLETISIMLSGVDRLLGRTHVLWSIVESTKYLPGYLTVPGGMIGSVGVASFSKRDAYLAQSLGRSWRSDSAHGQLSPRLEVAVLLPYRCY